MDNSRAIVSILLIIAFIACLFVIWTIFFRLKSHLISLSYKFIFFAKICFALLTGSGFYLILWPLKERVVYVQLGWFSILALGCISFSIGFYLYSKDVEYVLHSASYTGDLPATPINGVYKSDIPSKEA